MDRAILGWANLDGDEVDQLYVDPDAGGQGVARRLYEAVEQLARNSGLVELRAVASLRAEPFFRRFGFRELTRHERIFNGQTFTVISMTKDLDEARYRSTIRLRDACRDSSQRWTPAARQQVTAISRYNRSPD